MNALRELFLDTSEAARRALAHPKVREAWEAPSALESFSVKGLAGHLLRGTGSVLVYLDREEPHGPVIGQAEYYASAVEDAEGSGSAPNLGSKLHRAIRARGEEASAGGHAAVVEEADRLIVALRQRLAAEREDRLVSVFKGMVLTLDDYLITRIVELVVHIDDLAASLDADLAPPPDAAIGVALEALVEVARYRHGDLAVLRALSRRERDDVEALRVL